MTSDQIRAAIPARRVLAVPYRKPGYDLEGWQARVMTQNSVRTHDAVFATEAEALTYGETYV